MIRNSFSEEVSAVGRSGERVLQVKRTLVKKSSGKSEVWCGQRPGHREPSEAMVKNLGFIPSVTRHCWTGVGR